jgi:hypothetical protein
LEAENIDFERRRAEWLERIGNEMLKVHELMPLKFLPEGDYPQWLERVQEEIGPLMCPVAKVKEGIELTPKRLGALLGHECAYAVCMVEWFSEQVTAAEAKETGTEKDEEQIRQGIAMTDSFIKWYSALRRLAKRALCSSVDQTFEDMSDFLLAYSNAFARKPKRLKPGDIGSTNFEIYIFLIVYWRSIEQLKSVSELHQLLRKVLGEQRTGDLKRIEKICQRIGLHFRKPGRPKKSK